jgi:hypothetical protein
VVLPRPASPRDQQHLPAFTDGDPLERIQHRRQLGVSAHHTDRGANGQPPGQRHDRPRLILAERLPLHLDGLDGLGQTLQGESAQRTVSVPASATSRQPHDVGRQHLPARAVRTQPRRLDDRFAEIVADFAGHLTRAHTNPQAHRVLTPTAVPLDALLHRHRARQRRRRSTKHDHQTVAQVLHLDAAGFSGRLTQDREVGAPHFVGVVWPQTRQQRGRSHHVGEHHGHVLARHRRATPGHDLRQ